MLGIDQTFYVAILILLPHPQLSMSAMGQMFYLNTLILHLVGVHPVSIHLTGVHLVGRASHGRASHGPSVAGVLAIILVEDKSVALGIRSFPFLLSSCTSSLSFLTVAAL